MTKFAAIDLGSNSVRMSIFGIESKDKIENLESYRRTIGLSEGMWEDMTLKEAPMGRAIDALLDYRRIMDIQGISNSRAVATAAVRKAKNGQDFLARVKDAAGINLEVISGDEEARLDSLAIRKTLGCEKGIVCDIGGGSTELVSVGDRPFGISLPLGARNITERFFCDCESEENIRKAEKFADEVLGKESALDEFHGCDIVGIGGTIRALAKFDAWDFSGEAIAGVEITPERMEEISRQIAEASLPEREKMAGIGRERSGIILGGIVIFRSVMKRLSPKRIVVADIGVREGLAFQFAEKTE